MNFKAFKKLFHKKKALINATFSVVCVYKYKFDIS